MYLARMHDPSSHQPNSTTSTATPTGGLTDAANAKIGCTHHNLFKHHNSYQPQRHPNGTWHLHRPDGTKMQPPDAA